MHMDMLSRANWVDLLVVIIMLRTIYVSFQDGLSREIFPLFGSILNLVLALHFYGKLGSMLYSGVKIVPASICNLAGYLAVVLISGFTLKFLKIIVDTVIKVTWHPLIEKIGGMLAGVARGAVCVSMILIFLALVPLSYLQLSIKDKSLCGMLFLRIGPAIYRTVSGGRVNDERIVQNIASKKDIPVNSSKPAKDQPEWEKAFNGIEKKSGGAK